MENRNKQRRGRYNGGYKRPLIKNNHQNRTMKPETKETIYSTPENVAMLKRYASLRFALSKYVWLREDENGKRYIEYAFIEGKPHDNTCLSWYNSLQPEALKRNHHDPATWKISKVNEIYYLNMFSCGHQDADGEHHCSPGHYCETCRKGFEERGHQTYWSYDEPVKCACWYLQKVNYDDIRNSEIMKVAGITDKEKKEKAKKSFITGYVIGVGMTIVALLASYLIF